MSWTDKSAVRTILLLKKEFNSKEFIETGTFKGVNMRLYCEYFDRVYTCEANEEYYDHVLRSLPVNARLFHAHSPSFLKQCTQAKIQSDKVTDSIPIFYLDAHFYDPSLPPEKKFVVVEELQAMEGYKDCIIVIHDFKCQGLGHIVYDGIPLDFNLVKEALNKVNPNFRYYTNAIEYCNIITPEEVEEGKVPGVYDTEEVRDNLRYVWSSPEKTYRGILYAVPRNLDLSKYQLKPLEEK